MLHPFGDQHVAERLQRRHHGRRGARDHVVRQRRFPHDHPHRGQGTVIAEGVSAQAVVLGLESVEAHGHGAQPGIEQAFETFGGQRHAVGHHAPRIAAARDLAARLFEVGAQEHLAARKDDKHLRRVDMRCHLLVEHPQKILERHIRNPRIDPAIAAAVTAREVTTQRTLPKERIKAVFSHRRGMQIGKNIESQAFAQPQTTTVHNNRNADNGTNRELPTHTNILLLRLLGNGRQ